MRTYKTAEVAAAMGVHPNTVRLYEKLELILKPDRLPNGYRVFTELHMQQFRLARLAFQIEVLQNGLRKQIVQMVKRSAAGDFDGALRLAAAYERQVRQEREGAEEAAQIAARILKGETDCEDETLTRREVSERLHISMDTLRNWEMNGLLRVKRKQNGYRVYTGEDIRQLKIIRSLRCANYSLEAILNMLRQLSRNPSADIKIALDTPKEGADIIAVCDRLITSLDAAAANAREILAMLEAMRRTNF